MLQALRRILQLSVFAAVGTVIYFNIYVVPENRYGLLKEQTTGWQKPALEPGYHWLFTGFVPEKWQLYLLEKDPPAQIVEFKQGLQFTEYLGLDESFSVQLRLRLKYRIPQHSVFTLMRFIDNKPAYITQLVDQRLQILLEKKFYEFYQQEADIPRLRSSLLDYLQNTGDNDSLFQQDFRKSFNYDGKPMIELQRWEVLKLYVPDAEIYRQQTANIQEIFQARRQASVMKIIASARADQKRFLGDANYDNAEKFSKLISQYPQVLQYLEIENLSKEAKVIIMRGLGEYANKVGSGIAADHTVTEEGEVVQQEEQPIQPPAGDTVTLEEQQALKLPPLKRPQ